MNLLGDRIKETRLKLQLNTKNFAKSLNVEPSTVSNWEYGRRVPCMYMVVDIANLGNVSVDYLIGRTNPSTNDLIGIINNKQEYIFNFKTGKRKVTKEELQEIITKYEIMQEFILNFNKKISF